MIPTLLKYFLVPDRQVPFLVREGPGPQGPYSNYAYGLIPEPSKAALSHTDVKINPTSASGSESFCKNSCHLQLMSGNTKHPVL